MLEDIFGTGHGQILVKPPGRLPAAVCAHPGAARDRPRQLGPEFETTSGREAWYQKTDRLPSQFDSFEPFDQTWRSPKALRIRHPITQTFNQAVPVANLALMFT